MKLEGLISPLGTPPQIGNLLYGPGALAAIPPRDKFLEPMNENRRQQLQQTQAVEYFPLEPNAATPRDTLAAQSAIQNTQRSLYGSEIPSAPPLRDDSGFDCLIA